MKKSNNVPLNDQTDKKNIIEEENVDTKEEVETEKVEEQNEKQIIDDTHTKEDGQNKCPKCGATDISLNISNGKLRCNYCRYEFDAEKVGEAENLSELEGTIYNAGASDIIPDAKEIVTLKCSSCGAEVVIDTSEAVQARCHWCRNTLSINQTVPNGAVPDVVLPFTVKKEDAESYIRPFVNKRKFYANPTFKKEFTTANIMGVYFPYLVVDANAHSSYSGEGEHKVRSYTVKEGDNYRTYYDADEYHVERDFDITVEGLTVESSKDKLNNTAKEKTNNVINAIMPFDIENAVKWDANFLKGFTSEKRDVNVTDITPIVNSQVQDISRFAANESLTFYDRGVAWKSQNVNVKGTKWKAAYLPVWLYSYQEVKGNKKTLHYVAVNARTKETMGSVPIHMPLLIGMSLLVELLALLIVIFADRDYAWILLSAGIIFYFVMHSRYRNGGARHHHETETKKTISNLKQKDDLIRRKTRLSNATMSGANNRSVNGSTVNNNSFFNNMMQNDSTLSTINNVIKK